MEDFQVARDKAKKHIQIADHMLTQTYPLVGDPKLLLAVINNLFLACSHSISAILHYERIFKRIPPFVDNFENKFSIFKARCLRRYSLDPEYVRLVQEIRSLIDERSSAPVEFARRDKFIICSENYRMRTITAESLRKHLEKAKLFVDDMTGMVSKNERIFTRRV